MTQKKSPEFRPKTGERFSMIIDPKSLPSILPPKTIYQIIAAALHGTAYAKKELTKQRPRRGFSLESDLDLRENLAYALGDKLIEIVEEPRPAKKPKQPIKEKIVDAVSRITTADLAEDEE